MIEVQNLVKMYGDHTAVDHLSFRIEKGHIYGLLGPNGAGKSTTMNIMTGYLGATEGKVLIQGHDILKEPELAKKSIGYLPEQPPVYMDMTVQEYLQFAAELKKIPKKEREKQMNDVIRMTGIREVENRLIQNLLYISSQKNLNLSRRIFHTSSKSIRGRLLSYLSFQASKAGSRDFCIPFNRQQLADYLSIDRSAMSAELGKMRKEGILETDKNHFVLKTDLL